MKILCLGDSLTFGSGVPRSAAWTTLAGRLLGVELLNRGVPGDTTAGMLSRMHRELEANRPERISLLGGSNDIYFGQDDRPARANLAAMAHQCSARGLGPIICTPIPLEVAEAPAEWAGVVDFFAAQEMKREYAGWLRRFAAAFKLPLVDFWSAVEERRREPGGGAFYLDGLHPNAAGHAFLAEVYSSTVRPLL